MKTSELIIGNFIYIPKTSQIAIISLITDIDIIGVNKDSIGIGNLNIKNIKPVILTEEWLLKFGFIKYDDYFENNGFELDIQKVNDTVRYMFIVDGFVISVKLVHQLQNLYFALTGEELTYENERFEGF